MFQAGVARTAKEVRECLARQIDLACYGVEKPITEMQTATGTKDKIAQHWIDILLKKSREMKSSNPGRLSESIAEELREWLKSEPGDKMNPLLLIAGTLCSSVYWNFIHSSFRPGPDTRYTSRNPAYNPARDRQICLAHHQHTLVRQ